MRNAITSLHSISSCDEKSLAFCKVSKPLMRTVRGKGRRKSQVKVNIQSRPYRQCHATLLEYRDCKYRRGCGGGTGGRYSRNKASIFVACVLNRNRIKESNLDDGLSPSPFVKKDSLMNL